MAPGAPSTQNREGGAVGGGALRHGVAAAGGSAPWCRGGLPRTVSSGATHHMSSSRPGITITAIST
ncbi:MAG: hypothetical protein JWP29_4359, partial [Rhodoferax sp.]|nr:hypothetical protein [Rhodoferax sp.]